MKKVLILTVAASCAFAFFSCRESPSVENGAITASGNSQNASTVNTNGTPWKDTSGKTIQAHDSILHYQGKYYWYGLDYESNLINTGCDANGFRAVKCYESEDLVNWTLKNNVLTCNTSALLANCDLNNIQVVYNPNTHKFVMWAGYNKSYVGTSGLNFGAIRTTHNRLYTMANIVATSNSPYGNFEIANSFFYLHGGTTQTSLFVDEDGTGYSMGWANKDNSWRFYIDRLSDDYLGTSSTVAELYPETEIGRASVVKYGNFYYLFMGAFIGELDDATYNNVGSASRVDSWMQNKNGSTTNQSNDGFINYHFTYFDFYRDSAISKPMGYTGVRVAFASSMDGSWSDYGSFGPDDSSCEFSSVLKIQGTEETSYMLMFNKWNTADLSESGYVWYPVFFNKVSPQFSYPEFEEYQDITINAAKGTVTAE